MKKTVTKESLLYEIARLYKGITVTEFNRKFGGMTTGALSRRLRLAKAIFNQTGEML